MASQSPIVTQIGIDQAERFANVIAASFANDALNRAVILSDDALPNDAVISNERRVQHLLRSIRAQAEAGAILVEAGNWAAVALWIPAGIRAPALVDRTTPGPLVVEYFEKYTAIKKKHLGERQYWYLNLIGRQPERKEQGVIRALVEPYLQQAREAGDPVWLEATNSHARDVYTHLGFRTVAEVLSGEGILDSKGNRVAGGEGVTTYGMIVEPGE